MEKHKPALDHQPQTGDESVKQVIQYDHFTTFSGDISALSTDDQRFRVLEYLRHNRALTTLHARHHLNVMHPAARVMELRKGGHNIVTHRRQDADSAGRLHSVAEYVLMPEVMNE
ncbi:helix-turn-helix domain-containing protein [Marinobacter changyiensis]|uniref:helix-turn-helix domain-containing protein n=1 Tax=Marinobacter changyiensis TaxID=2604091 RepID=UPI001263FF36|nr:helix-turn-helix domain-containing protein [Marinobacter changyiensis]